MASLVPQVTLHQFDEQRVRSSILGALVPEARDTLLTSSVVEQLQRWMIDPDNLVLGFSLDHATLQLPGGERLTTISYLVTASSKRDIVQGLYGE